LAKLSLRNLGKRFGAVHALRELDLEIANGEFVAILGPSGCGKTTLLRLIAGFERASSGTAYFDDVLQESVDLHVPPERREIGMVFQSYALWPHMSVARNVGYPLRVRSVPKADAHERVAQALAQVGLSEYAERRPSELSGGQRQRVALARCLVMAPRVVLFDEPLANLDMHLRESMMHEFRAFHRTTGATILYVTHDQSEAMAMADRIVVLNEGVLQQIAPPRELYAQPQTKMVAGFVGRGTICPVEITAIDGASCTVMLNGVELTVRCDAPQLGPGSVCLRPEQLRLSSSSLGTLSGTVIESVYRGHVTTVVVALEGMTEMNVLIDTDAMSPAEGDRVNIAVNGGWCIPAN
jgi:iron(III) transport system ATP-binding protein